MGQAKDAVVKSIIIFAALLAVYTILNMFAGNENIPQAEKELFDNVITFLNIICMVIASFFAGVVFSKDEKDG